MGDALEADFNADEFVDQESDDGDIESTDQFGDEIDPLSDEVNAAASEYLGSDDAEDDEDSDEDSDDDSDEDEIIKAANKVKSEEVQPKDTRAQKRIQKLISEKKEWEKQQDTQRQEYEERIQQMQAQQQEYANWARQQQQQFYEQQAQYAATQKELELIRKQQELRDEENLSPEERFQRESVRRATEAIESEWSGKFAELQKQQQQMEQQAQQRQQYQEQQQRLNGYRQANQAAVANMLTGLSQELVDGLTDESESMVLNYAAAHGVSDMSEAAKRLDRWAHKYVLGKLKGSSRKNKQKLDKGQKTPQAAPKKRRSTKGARRKIPSQEELTKQGYEDSLAYMMRGE